MTNTFERFESRYLGCFNISTVLNFFKIIIQQNSILSEKEKKLLLDEFGIALKGETTTTIRKSIERISQYSAGPSSKSRSILGTKDRLSASTRLITFFKNNERQWAPTQIEREIFLFLLVTSLKEDPNYYLAKKRVAKWQLKETTLAFYYQLEANQTWDDGLYYALLTQFFNELLTNPNVYKFNGKYTLYQHAHQISTEANSFFEKTGKNYNPTLMMQQWLQHLTEKYDDLYYHLTTSRLSLLDIEILANKEEADYTPPFKVNSVSTSLNNLAAFLPQNILKLRLLEVLQQVALPPKPAKNQLSQKRHFTIKDVSAQQTLTCPYINLYSTSAGADPLPLFSFKFAEHSLTPLPPVYLNWEQKTAYNLSLSRHTRHHFPLFQTELICCHYYHHAQHCFYYDEINPYTIQAREFFWNNMDNADWLKQEFKLDDSKFSIDNLLQQIPTSLPFNLLIQTPLFAQVSLLVKTADQHYILSKGSQSFDEGYQLTFSSYRPIQRSKTGIDPLSQIKEMLLSEYNHQLDLQQLTLVSIGIDGDNYCQQFIYLYEINKEALPLLEDCKGALAYCDTDKFAIPHNETFIFQLMQQFDSKPSLTYVLLKLCQTTETENLTFELGN